MRTLVVFFVAMLVGLAIGGAVGQVDKHDRGAQAKAQDKIIQERVPPELADAVPMQ